MLPLIFPGFLSSSIIGRAPWPPSLDGPGPWISRVRTILARISQDLSYPPGASHRHASRPSLPFSTRIPTGVRTDSGEERFNGSSGNCVGDRVELEAPAVEVDRRLEVLRVPEAVGHLLDGLNLRVEAFTDGVGYPMSEESQ